MQANMVLADCSSMSLNVNQILSLTYITAELFHYVHWLTVSKPKWIYPPMELIQKLINGHQTNYINSLCIY